MAYLKHKDTGEIFPYNPDLALNVDMLPCDAEGNDVDEPEAEDLPKTVKSRKKAPEPKPLPSEAEADEFLSGINV